MWKVGFIVRLSQVVEYNLANILSANELPREFDTNNSMRIVYYNELAQKSNEIYHKLSGTPLGGILRQAKKHPVGWGRDSNLIPKSSRILEESFSVRSFSANAKRTP